MSQVTIISGVERRRVWTDEQKKRALVAAACEPGANVAEIARRADLRPSQLYRWRRDLAKAAPGFAAVMVSTDHVQAASGAAMVVELGGAVLRIAADAPPALVSAVVRSLRR